MALLTAVVQNWVVVEIEPLSSSFFKLKSSTSPIIADVWLLLRRGHFAAGRRQIFFKFKVCVPPQQPIATGVASSFFVDAEGRLLRGQRAAFTKYGNS